MQKDATSVNGVCFPAGDAKCPEKKVPCTALQPDLIAGGAPAARRPPRHGPVCGNRFGAPAHGSHPLRRCRMPL